jgi:hypothetical protein
VFLELWKMQLNWHFLMQGGVLDEFLKIIQHIC